MFEATKLRNSQMEELTVSTLVVTKYQFVLGILENALTQSGCDFFEVMVVYSVKTYKSAKK